MRSPIPEPRQRWRTRRAWSHADTSERPASPIYTRYGASYNRILYPGNFEVNLSEHVKASQKYRPLRGGGIHPDLERERKKLASRYYQLLSGHASTRAYLAGKVRKILSSVLVVRL